MAIHNFNYSVSWSDFNSLQSRPPGEKEDAQIHPEMSFSNFQLKGKGKSVIVVDVDLEIKVVKFDSWSVVSVQSPDLLLHEQGHYDILALSARDFYRQVKLLVGKSTADLQRQVTDLQEKMNRRVNAIDKRYDTETNHSRDTAKQTAWNKSIAKQKQKPDGGLDGL
jgi:hypothetical protein